MNKHFNLLAVAIIVLLMPSLLLAAGAHMFATGKAIAKEASEIVVPLNITNEANLTAIDIPLKFSEGVTLKEVTFEGTRTAYFDLKIANINNEENTVVIGLLPQITPVAKPDLEAGTGPVANLVFTIDDPAITEITLETIQLRNPGHFLCFVYHDFDADGTPHSRTEFPEYEPVTVALSGVSPTEAGLPVSWDLKQNYPNPFNALTRIAFDVPKAGYVDVSIYNILGQKVETLVDGEMEAGSYSYTWDANSFSSGIYFYRITGDNFTNTKKMAYIK